MENNSKDTKSLNEKRIRELTMVYYSNPEIRKAIFNFSENRECIPRYYDGFGKRPDNFQYELDILEQVKRGATSFHCSEEIWEDALEISNEFSEQEFNSLRIGWDLLLDIDSPYLEYSKIYTCLLIEVLRFNGVENIGVKFSVAGDTNILIKLGENIKLARINNVIELLKKGIRLDVLSLNKNGKLQFSKIYNYLEHEDILYNIYHSQSKIPLKSTGHHSVFIWYKGEILQKKVSELKKGDYLVSYNAFENPFVQDNKGLINKFEFSKNQFSKEIIERKIPLTSGLMRLIGYFLAEGHTTKIINQVGFSFNRGEIEYIKDVTDLLKNITKRKISIRHPNKGSTQILIHSKEWYNFFKNFCGEKKQKHVPEFSWKVPRNLFLEMLRGYIRGDGYKMGEYRIVVKSVSKRLIKEFVWLCKLNNISCSLSCEQNKPHKLPQGNYFKGSFVYILNIPKSELPSLEFNRDRNKLSPYPRDKIFPIDGLKEVYYKIKPKIFNHHRPEQVTLRKKRANLKRIRKVLNWFEKFKSIDYDYECKRIILNYEKLFDSDISVVEVKEVIKREKQKVYDVSVEETEAFFGNDYPILLHNSGNKGFHIIIPWKAFPEEVYGQKTKDMFPEWPRAICNYLSKIIQPKLAEKIFEQEDSLKEIAKRTGKKQEELLITECLSCHKPAEKRELVTWECPNCKNEVIMLRKTKRIPKCPNDDCRNSLVEIKSKEIFYCKFCDINSNKEPDMFAKERQKTESLIEADLILVAPRHLFRMPYSLHEKTALSSIVIDKEKVKEFQITDAKPFKKDIKNFYPDAKPDEARELLLQALDLKEQNEATEKFQIKPKPKEFNNIKKDYKQVKIPNPTIDLYPPCIKNILKGVKQDGRKRALFVLINFFKSLGLDNEELETQINEWNEKNYKPLKQGYVRSQLYWHNKQNSRLPPNCDKPNYNDLGVCSPDELCRQVKNPVNYAMKMYFKKK